MVSGLDKYKAIRFSMGVEMYVASDSISAYDFEDMPRPIIVFISAVLQKQKVECNEASRC